MGSGTSRALVICHQQRWTSSHKKCPNHTARNQKMSASAQSPDIQTNDTPVELVDLSHAIDALPAAQRLSLQPAFQKVVDSTNRRRKILQLVQEALGQLRLDMKYLVFDLEATRRERDLYQQQLREWTGENEGGNNSTDSDEEAA